MKAGTRVPERRQKLVGPREQDAILPQVVTRQSLGDRLPRTPEQDAISRQVVLIQALVASLVPPSDLPEQDEIGARVEAWQDLGRRVVERGSG